MRACRPPRRVTGCKHAPRRRLDSAAAGGPDAVVLPLAQRVGLQNVGSAGGIVRNLTGIALNMHRIVVEFGG